MTRYWATLYLHKLCKMVQSNHYGIHMTRNHYYTFLRQYYQTRRHRD